jgi:hypothetical protein
MRGSRLAFLLRLSTRHRIFACAFWELGWHGHCTRDRSAFILNNFFESVYRAQRLYPPHLASAALQLRVKRTVSHKEFSR